MFFLLLFLDGLDIYRRVHMLTTTRRRSNSLNLISTQHSRAQLAVDQFHIRVSQTINCWDQFSPVSTAVLSYSSRTERRLGLLCQLHLLAGINQIFETFKSHGLIILYSMLFSCISHRCIINWGKRLNCKIKQYNKCIAIECFLLSARACVYLKFLTLSSPNGKKVKGPAHSFCLCKGGSMCFCWM